MVVTDAITVRYTLLDVGLKFPCGVNAVYWLLAFTEAMNSSYLLRLVGLNCMLQSHNHLNICQLMIELADSMYHFEKKRADH